MRGGGGGGGGSNSLPKQMAVEMGFRAIGDPCRIVLTFLRFAAERPESS